MEAAWPCWGGACGTKCQCQRPFTGSHCELYRRCFADVRLCYQTDYTRLNYDGATEHCLRQGQLTKPVVLSRFEAFSLRVFVEDDVSGRLKRGSVWLGAEARRLPDHNSAHWQWISGLKTSMCSLRLQYNLFCWRGRKTLLHPSIHLRMVFTARST